MDVVEALTIYVCHTNSSVKYIIFMLELCLHGWSELFSVKEEVMPKKKVRPKS
jgi:hypothetical protein